MFIHNLTDINFSKEEIYICKNITEYRKIKKLGFEPIGKKTFLITDEFRKAVMN